MEGIRRPILAYKIHTIYYSHEHADIKNDDGYLIGASMNKSKIIIIVESLIFFLFGSLFFLWGADSPPPAGFWKLIVLVFVLAGLQAIYLSYFWSRFIKQAMFLKNALIFFCVGVFLALLGFGVMGGMELEQLFWWALFVGSVSLAYGIILYFVNSYFIKKLTK